MTCNNQNMETQFSEMRSAFLTENTLNLLFSFEDWTFPELYREDILEGPTFKESWHYSNLEIFAKFGLSSSERKELEKIMEKNRIESVYSPIFKFAEWCMSNTPFHGWDHKIFSIFNNQYDHFITKNGVGVAPDFGKDCDLDFWKTYYKIQMFENMLPHFTSSIRVLISEFTDAKDELSQEIHP